MKLKQSDKLSMINGCLKVNDKLFVVDHPDEILYDVEDNKLVTLFRGHLHNYWEPEEIDGYFA